MPDPTPPLIVTGDEQLLDDALRWCAAAGAIPDLAHDVASARRSWRHAAVVLVGDDLAEVMSRADLPRRDDVVVVARDPADLWPAAVALGAVAVCRPHEEDRVLELISSALEGGGEACVVSLVGGCGGVGTSTLAASLALAGGRRGLSTLLLDADPSGGGLELLMGAERVDGLRWHDFGASRDRLSAGSLADVLPVHRDVATLSWRPTERGPLPGSMPSVLTAAMRGFDLVVADVPRHLDVHASDVVGRSVLSLLLVPEEICGIAAARQTLEQMRDCAPAVALVTVARPGGVGPAAVSEALELPVLVRHRHDRRVRGAIDRGHGPGRSRAGRRTSARVLDTLGLEPS
ncbi:MAG: hypothetical protein JWP31_2576 [Aeromicrobium sp.]|nr:hypothetical protein [Aeromicrobium sp.]